MSFLSPPSLQHAATPPTRPLMSSPLFWEHSALIYTPTTEGAHFPVMKKMGSHIERNPLHQQWSCQV